MPKNIILCSDGTGNRGGKSNSTNVWRLYNSIDLTDEDQVRFYDDGVGTEDYKLWKILGGAFGIGLLRNARDLYTYLIKNYKPGDRIYLFGFSRGAYTIRLLVGMIHTCGIIDVKGISDTLIEKKVKKVFNLYKYSQYYPHVDLSDQDIEKEIRDKVVTGYRVADNKVIEDINGKDVPIEFVGVWDTVSAFGLPPDLWMKKVLVSVLDWLSYRSYFFLCALPVLEFRTKKLSCLVNKGRQALAIDDKRHTFTPILWDQEIVVEGQDIQQRWFCGMHSNVGGGYPKDQLSLVSLNWMMDEAEASGLNFHNSNRDAFFEQADPYGKIYDSRSGLAAYYRYRVRDIEGLCKENSVDVVLDSSVTRRIKNRASSYLPENIPVNLNKSADDSYSQKGKCELFEKAKELNKIQQMIYYCFLVLSVFFLWTGFQIPADTENPIYKAASTVMPDFVASYVGNHLLLFIFILVFCLLWKQRDSINQRIYSLMEERWREEIKDTSKYNVFRFYWPIASFSIICVLFIAAQGYSFVFKYSDDQCKVQNVSEVNFDTSCPEFHTGIMLKAGSSYRITLNDDGDWYDGSHRACYGVCGQGFDANDEWMFRVFSFIKRVPEEKWFRLIGQVNDNFQFGIDNGMTFTALSSGELVLFVNDADQFYIPLGINRWAFYKNNIGTEKVIVRDISKQGE